MRTRVVRVVRSARLRATMAVCALLALAPPSFSQGESPSKSSAGAALPADAERSALVLEGFVLAPDGNPAEGAVVVSSADGRAVTDAAGSYRFAVELSPEAASVQVTAVGGTGGNRSASTSVAVQGEAMSARLDPLQLASGVACTPSWLPTFGGHEGTSDGVWALAV